jgi:hypothetical protein
MQVTMGTETSLTHAQCQNLDACSDRLHEEEEDTFADEDIRCVYQYLGREYNLL